VTFDDVALHQRGMTRIELLRYLVFNLDIRELLIAEALLFNVKTIRLQVPDPR
jgi:hypothetical protein